MPGPVIVGTAVPIRGGALGSGAGITWVDPVINRTTSTPPGSPTPGDRYIVAASATGDWAGKEDWIAEWNGAIWEFTEPVTGLTAYVTAETEYYSYNGSAWVMESFGPHRLTHEDGGVDEVRIDNLPALAAQYNSPIVDGAGGLNMEILKRTWVATTEAELDAAVAEATAVGGGTIFIKADADNAIVLTSNKTWDLTGIKIVGFGHFKSQIRGFGTYKITLSGNGCYFQDLTLDGNASNTTENNLLFDAVESPTQGRLVYMFNGVDFNQCVGGNPIPQTIANIDLSGLNGGTINKRAYVYLHSCSGLVGTSDTQKVGGFTVDFGATSASAPGLTLAIFYAQEYFGRRPGGRSRVRVRATGDGNVNVGVDGDFSVAEFPTATSGYEYSSMDGNYVDEEIDGADKTIELLDLPKLFNFTNTAADRTLTLPGAGVIQDPEIGLRFSVMRKGTSKATIAVPTGITVYGNEQTYAPGSSFDLDPNEYVNFIASGADEWIMVRSLRSSMVDFKTNGVIDPDTDVTASFTDTGPDRTFSIQPTGTSFGFYSDGERYNSTGATKQIADTEGTHYIYFDDAGAIQETTTFDTRLITQWCFLAAIQWDATNKKQIYYGREHKHGILMSSMTHRYLHSTRGFALESGGALTSITADAAGDADSHAQFGNEATEAWDEDAEFVHTLRAITGTIPVYYRSGADASDIWRIDESASFGVLTTGTGRAAWNELTGGNWQQTEVANNNFVLAHVFTYNDSDRKFAVIQGQTEYNNIPAAQEGALTEINAIILAGLPSAEFKFLGTIIYQTSDSYTNTPQSRIRTTDDGSDYVDLRDQLVGRGGAVGTLYEPLIDQDKIIYFGKHGDDSNDGRSIGRAFLTLGAAIVAATPGGDTVVCHDGGTYVENIATVVGVNIFAPHATLNGLLNMLGAGTWAVFYKIKNNGDNQCISKPSAGECSITADIIESDAATTPAIIHESGGAGNRLFVEAKIIKSTDTPAFHRSINGQGAHTYIRADRIESVNANAIELESTVAAARLSIIANKIIGANGIVVTDSTVGSDATIHVNELVGATNAWNVEALSTLQIFASKITGAKVGAGTIKASWAGQDIEDHDTSGDIDTVPVSQGDGTLLMQSILGAISALKEYEWAADNSLIPNSADWDLGVPAAIIADPTNAAITVAAFDDTTEESIGAKIRTPAAGTRLGIIFSVRPSSSQTGDQYAQFTMRYRKEGATIGSWAEVEIPKMLVPDSDVNFYDHVRTWSLTALSMDADAIYRIEISRNTGGSDDTVTGDVYVSDFPMYVDHFDDEWIEADVMASPVNADWAVNANAGIAADSNNAAIGVRRFDDTSEEGAGRSKRIPAGVTKLAWKDMARNETTPTSHAVDSFTAGSTITLEAGVGDVTAQYPAGRQLVTSGATNGANNGTFTVQSSTFGTNTVITVVETSLVTEAASPATSIPYKKVSKALHYRKLAAGAAPASWVRYSLDDQDMPPNEEWQETEQVLTLADLPTPIDTGSKYQFEFTRKPPASHAIDSFTAGSTITLEAGVGDVTALYQAGQKIVTSGATNAANNGVFEVQSVAFGTNTVITVVETSLVTEAASPGTCKDRVDDLVGDYTVSDTGLKLY